MKRRNIMNDFVKQYRATQRDIKNNNAKRCTFDACASHDDNVLLTHDAFHVDNAQRDALCVWCRACERTYDNARIIALRACNDACDTHTIRVRRDINAINDATTRDTLHAIYDEHMTNVRSRRHVRRNNETIA